MTEVFLREIYFPEKSYEKLYPGRVPEVRSLDSKKILRYGHLRNMILTVFRTRDIFANDFW